MTIEDPSQPIRVLMIRNPQPYDFGGGERIPVHLAVEIAKFNYKTILVSRAPKVLEYAEAKKIQSIKGWWWSRQNWSGRSNLLLPFYFIWQLILTGWYIQLILRTHSDVIHPQGKDDFIAATIAGRLLGKHIVWSDYADLKYIYENHTIWYKNPIGKLIYKLSGWANAIILTSHSDESSIKEALGKKTLPKQYIVVYNGVVDQSVKPVKRDIKDKSAYIYCATSRLVTAKGIGELINAFLRLNESHSDTRLWLVGDGPETDEFKTVANNHPAIVFFGHVEQPLGLVAASDVFTHPSYLEGFSISLIEAAMLERPIIACNVGGNPEIIIDHQTGLLIPDRNTDALHDAMLLLYNDRGLAQKMAQNARARFENELQFERIVAEQFVPLYEKAN